MAIVANPMGPEALLVPQPPVAWVRTTKGFFMPLLDLFWTMLAFFLFFAWMWVLITIFIDIFRSPVSGWAKAGWVLFVIFLPLLGVLVYLIVHGGDMQKRSIEQAAAMEKAQRDYIQNVAGGSGADELEKLARLRDDGVLSDEEFTTQKAKLLGG